MVTGADYSVERVTEALLASLRGPYEAAFPEEYLAQDLELLVGGYDPHAEWPVLCRLDVRANRAERVFQEGEFGIAFAGQMDWIQRIVFGTDNRNRVKLRQRSKHLIHRYRELALEQLAREGHAVPLPEVDSLGEELELFREWDLDGLEPDWAQFSEQNAIDCVDFFLTIMIKAQDVAPQLPTVGGPVHIAVVRRDGFHPVTKEVWRHNEHEVAIPEVGT
jgi:hypothetical protein